MGRTVAAGDLSPDFTLASTAGGDRPLQTERRCDYRDNPN
jgi:hypothetical protein